ncbi:MAG: lipopolysaccharide assembly protein LapA domain-containing protein, partial [bacterium]
FAFLLVLLAVVNQPQVSMNLLFWRTPEVSLIVFVFAAILVGGIFATILGMVTQMKSKKDLTKKEKEIKELEERVVKLQLAAGKSEETKEEKKPSPEIEPQE